MRPLYFMEEAALDVVCEMGGLLDRHMSAEAAEIQMGRRTRRRNVVVPFPEFFFHHEECYPALCWLPVWVGR
jgi:hypothetical protein